MIIGLAGKKRSGKTTVAKYLKESHGFFERSWASPLKIHIGKGLFDLSDEQIEGSEYEKEKIDPRWGYSSRQILQIVGTDLFRKHFDEYFWVKVGMMHFNKDFARFPNVDFVFSDCRFPNELNALHNFAKNKNIPYASVNVIRHRIAVIIDTDTHASENSLGDYPFTHTLTAGDGELELLYKQMGEVLNALRNK